MHLVVDWIQTELGKCVFARASRSMTAEAVPTSTASSPLPRAGFHEVRWSIQTSLATSASIATAATSCGRVIVVNEFAQTPNVSSSMGRTVNTSISGGCADCIDSPIGARKCGMIADLVFWPFPGFRRQQSFLVLAALMLSLCCASGCWRRSNPSQMCVAYCLAVHPDLPHTCARRIASKSSNGIYRNVIMAHLASGDNVRSEDLEGRAG